MRNETIAIHAGYEPEATTHAVAVPIYQTAAYAFDSADHGAALFNLETEGFRYSRSATAPRTRCSPTSGRGRASPAASPRAMRPMRSRS